MYYEPKKLGGYPRFFSFVFIDTSEVTEETRMQLVTNAHDRSSHNVSNDYLKFLYKQSAHMEKLGVSFKNNLRESEQQTQNAIGREFVIALRMNKTVDDTRKPIATTSIVDCDLYSILYHMVYIWQFNCRCTIAGKQDLDGLGNVRSASDKVRYSVEERDYVKSMGIQGLADMLDEKPYMDEYGFKHGDLNNLIIDLLN